MAFVLCWSLYDKDGKHLYPARGGRMPYDGASYEVEERLRWDLLQILERRPDLRVVALSDGAPEMINILQRVTEGVEVEVQLVDVWHALEYVADACRALGIDPALELARAKKYLFDHDDGAVQVLRRMQRLRTERRTAKKPVPKLLTDAIRHFENKLAAGLMDYGRRVENESRGERD